MKKVKRISAIIIAVIFLSSFFAIPVNAVDPMTATAIANGFAQAITAYGAANGVSLTFDGVESGNTAQIGEAIHDLWSRFRADQQTTDDYLAIGEALMPSLFYKAEKAAGTAAIGISIAQEYMPDIDAFWNWVLSGPAEMVKVDNAYQWNSNNGVISPIVVQNSVGINGYSVAKSDLFDLYHSNNNQTWEVKPANAANNGHMYAYRCTQNGSEFMIFFFDVSGYNYVSYRYKNLPDGNYTSWSNASLNTYYINGTTYSYARLNGVNGSNIPLCAMVDNSYAPDKVLGLTTEMPTPVESSVSVQPYVGDAVAKPVPIPDTTDPDYGPIDWTGDLDIPWNDTLFGDGTGTLTNEQTSDIIGTIDQAIVQSPDKTIELDTETDIPIEPDPPAPSEIIIPFLPVEIPSFNFSLSGIWHYVREWVASLGSWFALVFTVWGVLPYALVVPVYATAVIVIVLGVYKRFFM